MARLLLNAAQSALNWSWAALLLIAVGLGLFAGTLALARTRRACWGDCLPKAWKTPRLNPHRPQAARRMRYTHLLVRHLAAGTAAADQLHPAPLGKTTFAPPPCWARLCGRSGARCRAFTGPCSRCGRDQHRSCWPCWRWWRWWIGAVTGYARRLHSARLATAQTHRCCAAKRRQPLHPRSARARSATRSSDARYPRL